MTKSKTMKRAMISSVIALVICFAMLIGTTYAWFTDSVASSGNIIKSGTLQIDLLVKGAEFVTTDLTADSEGYYSLKAAAEAGKPTAVFNYDLWEPGFTDWANVKVENNGSLALKYTMRIAPNGNASNLAEVIDVYYAPLEVTKPTTRSLDGLTKIGTLKDVIDLAAGVVIDDHLLAGEKDYATIVLHMQESAGNEYQNLSLGTDFTIQILATQYTSEVDSFDELYDENAEYAAADLYAAEGLTVVDLGEADFAPIAFTVEEGADDAAVAAAKDAAADNLKELLNESTDQGIAILAEGETLVWKTGSGHGSTPLLTEDQATTEVVIDGGAAGAEMVFTGAGVGEVRAANDGTLVFKNVTIIDESVSYSEGSWEFGYLEFAGKIRFENCTFKSAITLGSSRCEENEVEFINCTFETETESSSSVPTPSNMYDVWMSHGSATFTNCTFSGPYRGLKIHEAYGSDVDEVVVDGCTFGPFIKKPGIAIGTVDATTVITLKNNTFNNCQAGDQGLYAYEYDTALTSFVFSEEGTSVVND